MSRVPHPRQHVIVSAGSPPGAERRSALVAVEVVSRGATSAGACRAVVPPALVHQAGWEGMCVCSGRHTAYSSMQALVISPGRSYLCCRGKLMLTPLSLPWVTEPHRAEPGLPPRKVGRRPARARFGASFLSVGSGWPHLSLPGRQDAGPPADSKLNPNFLLSLSLRPCLPLCTLPSGDFFFSYLVSETG